jgi:hypothetical protein
MDVIAAAPFAAGSIAWQSLPGQWTLTVVCKATYALGPGTSPLAGESEPVHARDTYVDDDPERSVHAPSDLAPIKPRPEVTLVGNAFAPRGEPTRSLVVRVRIGLVDKAIDVIVPRTIMSDGAVREGAPWKQMPLLYERAAGGAHTWNPLGMSRDTVDRHGRRSLPNLQPCGLGIATNEAIEPMGFGPISSAWSIRRERLGIRETSWSDEGWWENPLGAGFDAAYFQTAPADQWLDQLHADETITLENLHPDHALLTTRLAGVAPRARVEVLGEPAWDLDLVADSLWIDTNRSIATLTWRAQLRVESRDQAGRVVIGAEEKAKPVRWPARDAGNIDGEALHTTQDDEQAANALRALDVPVGALPFRPSPPSARGRQAAPTLASPPERRAWSDDGTEVAKPSFGSGPGSMPAWLTSQSEALPAAINPPAPVSNSFGARRHSETTEVPSAAKLGVAALSNAAAVAPPSVVFGEHRGPPSTSISDLYAGKVDDRALGAAAYGGVLQASNAAAGTAPVRTNGTKEAATRAPVDASPRALQELVWFDPAQVDRIRAVERWADFLVEPPKADDEKKAAAEKARADRASVVGVLGLAETVHDVEIALQTSIDDDGLFEPPLGVIGGDLEVVFDDVETLKILSGAAGPLAPGDKRMKDVLDLASEVTKTPLGVASEVAANFVARIREAWTREKRMLPPDYLDHHTRRLLLEQRLYQKRQLADAEWIRALLTPPNASSAIPAYLPVAMGRWLPLFARFPARVIATIVPQQDHSEASPVALFVCALSRTLSQRPRLRG